MVGGVWAVIPSSLTHRHTLKTVLPAKTFREQKYIRGIKSVMSAHHCLIPRLIPAFECLTIRTEGRGGGGIGNC